MKIFKGAAISLADVERTVLIDLGRTLSNIPLYRDLYQGEEFCALILTPIGFPVLPCAMQTGITPKMLITLLDVVRVAHELGWIHRDIKPDNIYLDQNDSSRIVLNDWSSAAKQGEECRYVGTSLFGDTPGASGRHTPEPRLDLRALVRTAYCLCRQRLPYVEDKHEAIEEYWAKIAADRPIFSKALEFADAIDYKGLEELFGNVW